MSKKNYNYGHNAASSERTELEMDRVWKPVFDRYDPHKTGHISIQEFKRILQESNSHLSEDISPELLDKLIHNADILKDGVITYDEFLQLVQTTELGMERPRLHRLIRYAAMAVVPKSARQSVIRRYLEEYSCLPPPVFIIIISIIEIAFFIYYCVVLKEVSAIGPVPWQSSLIYNPCRRDQIWRFGTYIFIHAGFYHVFFNVLIQLLLGVPLEMVHKWWRVGIVYIAGVVAGSLASSITDPYSFLAGASGGVYALLAAHLASVVINWSEMEFSWLRLISLLAFISTDVGVAIYGRYVKEESSRVSYSAHFFGALVGFLIGVNTLRNLKMRRWEIIIGWVFLVIYGLGMAFAILFNLLNHEYFIDPTNPDRCKMARNQ